MKKRIACLLLTMSLCALCACHAELPAPSETPPEEPQTLRFAVDANDPLWQAAADHFASLAQTLSGGSLTVEPVDAGTDADLYYTDLNRLEEIEPHFRTLRMPFVFKNYDQTDMVLNTVVASSDLMQQAEQTLQSSYLAGFAAHPSHILTGLPRESLVDDFSDMRIGLVDDSYTGYVLESFGAEVVYFDTPEERETAYLAGELNAIEGKLDDLAALTPEQGNLFPSYHQLDFSFLFIRNDALASLSEAQRAALYDAVAGTLGGWYEQALSADCEYADLILQNDTAARVLTGTYERIRRQTLITYYDWKVIERVIDPDLLYEVLEID